MKKVKRDAPMKREYDFSGGVRGKYAGRYAQGTNLVRLDPEVRALFPDSGAVHRALRTLATAGRPRTKRVRKSVELAQPSRVKGTAH